MTSGQIGYEAYARFTGGKTFDGRQMPKWDELPANIKDAWDAAATSIKAGAVMADRDYDTCG
jgi:hypothetical protein